mgnify:CR=1 FL=1
MIYKNQKQIRELVNQGKESEILSKKHLLFLLEAYVITFTKLV